MKRFVSAIIVSAGNSTRMGGINKQFLLIDRIPVIVHSVMAFQKNTNIDEIIIVTREKDIANVNELTKKYALSKVKAVVNGGNSRQESVLNGVSSTSKDSDFLVIHDGARPLVSEAVINNTLMDAFMYDAAATGIKVKDTVKIVDSQSFIKGTEDREYLRFVQTPQIFKKSLYLDAVNCVDNSNLFTDDCMLIEEYGKKVYLSSGEYENIKITTPEDILLAETYYKRRKQNA